MIRTTKCENPFMGSGGAAYGCGRCLPCKLKKRREWTHRIMLEAGLHADNSFVTLTYAEDPFTLEPHHHRQFMDALRKRVLPLKLRYYMVGEYGDLSFRPHFHYALFGYPSCKRATTKPGKYRCCSACDVIEDVWGQGRIDNQELTPGRCRYIARYVVKKMTRWDDPRLGNRHPEFARMSLKPGIGHGALRRVAHTISRYDLLTPQGDVPVTLAHGTMQWPLGRYLRKKLRKELGLDETAPHLQSARAAYIHSQTDAATIEMRALQKASIVNSSSLKEEVLKASASYRAQIARRLDMFTKQKGNKL